MRGTHLQRLEPRRLALCSDLSSVRARLRLDSFGIMVNYEYDAALVEGRHSAYVSEGVVQASPRVWRLVRGETAEAEETA